MEEENLIDLKKLSLDEIVSLTNKPSNHYITLTRQLNEVNYLHKCFDGTILDIRGNHPIHKRMDSDHLKNLFNIQKIIIHIVNSFTKDE
jgi:hypothetical protein